MNFKNKPHPLTGAKEKCFFGYYDVPAFSGDGSYHLCHRVKFQNRLPRANDVAQIGLVEVATGRYEPLGETTAWNFQQGAMLQWNPEQPNEEIIFNNRINGALRGVMMNIRTGKQTILTAPVANISPRGRLGLSLNFSRLYDYRPGYGYTGVADPFRRQNHPAEDGVFAMDLASGTCRLVLNLEQIWQFACANMRLHEAKLTINHVTFNPDGTRFILLARTGQGPKKRRVTVALTAGNDGDDLRCLTKYRFASHYHWRDATHLMLYSENYAGKQLYLYEDQHLAQPEMIDQRFFRGDGHCSFSPNREWILYDDTKYSGENQKRLYLYCVSKAKGMTLGAYASDQHLAMITREIRCDLHPRWNAQNTVVSFDSVHEGNRRVYFLDLREAMRALESSATLVT